LDNFDYNKWAKKRVDELIHSQVKKDNCYDEELIREYLIFAQYSRIGESLIDFFKENNSNDNLFKVVIEILLDESEDYSNDARYSAVKIISLFNLELLKKYKRELLYAQKYELVSLRPFSDNNIPSWLYEDISS